MVELALHGLVEVCLFSSLLGFFFVVSTGEEFLFFLLEQDWKFRKAACLL